MTRNWTETFPSTSDLRLESVMLHKKQIECKSLLEEEPIIMTDIEMQATADIIKERAYMFICLNRNSDKIYAQIFVLTLTIIDYNL